MRQGKKKALPKRIEPEKIRENSNKEGTTNELREEEQLMPLFLWGI